MTLNELDRKIIEEHNKALEKLQKLLKELGNKLVIGE